MSATVGVALRLPGRALPHCGRAVEVQYALAEVEGVASLDGCGLGLLHVGLYLLELRGCGLAVLILALHQSESRLSRSHRHLAALALTLCCQRIVIGLLYVLVERLARLLEL